MLPSLRLIPTSIRLALFSLSLMACEGGGSEAPAPTAVPEPTATLALAGNGFVTLQGTGAAPVITEQGLGNWSDPGAVVSVFFRAEQSGTCKLGLVASLTGSTRSMVKVSALGQSFEVMLSAGIARAYKVGTVQVAKPGYVRVDLQGVSKDGGDLGAISALQVIGAMSSQLVFANDPENFYWSRRGPSVHMGYTTPAQTEYFYNEMTVPVGEDNIGSYVMSNGFAEGYFGIQVNSATERRVLFSVWDPSAGKTTLVRKGEGVAANDFGGEGTGGQSFLVFPWKAGSTYRFLTRAVPDGAGATLYSAWFFAPEAGAWRFIATWKRPATTTYLKNCHSFLENFYDELGHLGRKVFFGNQWARPVNGAWTECTSGRYTGDATATKRQRLDFAGGVEGGAFYLRNGAFFDAMVPVNQTFSRPATGRMPEIDLPLLP